MRKAKEIRVETKSFEGIERMKITAELVDYIAQLSRLALSEEERAAMAAELEGIVGYMDVLSQLPTDGVEPMSHVFPVKNVLREDVVEPSCDRSALLKNAPVPDAEAFLVPKAVE